MQRHAVLGGERRDPAERRDAADPHDVGLHDLRGAGTEDTRRSGTPCAGSRPPRSARRCAARARRGRRGRRRAAALRSTPARTPRVRRPTGSPGRGPTAGSRRSSGRGRGRAARARRATRSTSSARSGLPTLILTASKPDVDPAADLREQLVERVVQVDAAAVRAHRCAHAGRAGRRRDSPRARAAASHSARSSPASAIVVSPPPPASWRCRQSGSHSASGSASRPTAAGAMSCSSSAMHGLGADLRRPREAPAFDAVRAHDVRRDHADRRDVARPRPGERHPDQPRVERRDRCVTAARVLPRGSPARRSSCSGVGSTSGARTLPTGSPPSRSPALMSETPKPGVSSRSAHERRVEAVEQRGRRASSPSTYAR